MDETTYYKSGNIEITPSIARFGNTSYPIANIGAVSIEETPNPVLVLGVVVAIVGIGSLFFDAWWWWLALVAGIAMIAAFLYKPGAKLMLRTSSGNEAAFQSDDKALVENLKSAIERAVAQRKQL